MNEIDTDSELLFRGRQVLDAIIYAVAVTALVVLGSTVIGFTMGGGWVGVKFILFFVGIGLFGVATFKARPTAPWRDGTTIDSQTDSESVSWVGTIIQRVPPIDRYRLHPSDQFSDGVKLYLASVLVLAVSFLMETVLGVAR